MTTQELAIAKTYCKRCDHRIDKHGKTGDGIGFLSASGRRSTPEEGYVQTITNDGPCNGMNKAGTRPCRCPGVVLA